MSNHPMTTFGKKLIEDELNRLIKIEREGLKIALAEARALGDLKENAEYHAAKEKQSLIEGRIAELQGKLAKAHVIDVMKLNSEKVVFGATITLIDVEKDQIVEVQIVGEDEAGSHHQKISYNSPLGRALIGKEVGDEVVVKAPKGDIVYQVDIIVFKILE